jgi:hypothetical protein
MFRTTLTRLAGGTLIAAGATVALAVPSTAMTAPGPEPVGTSSVHHSTGTSSNGSTDWADVGLGVAGGIALSGATYFAASALTRTRRVRIA